MAMVHEKLYQQEEESNAILLPIYLQYLINEIKNSANSRSDIDINLDCSNDYLSIDMAIPIAMIVSELLTQAMNKSFSSVFGRSTFNFVNTSVKRYHVLRGFRKIWF